MTRLNMRQAIRPRPGSLPVFRWRFRGPLTAGMGLKNIGVVRSAVAEERQNFAAVHIHHDDRRAVGESSAQIAVRRKACWHKTERRRACRSASIVSHRLSGICESGLPLKHAQPPPIGADEREAPAWADRQAMEFMLASMPALPMMVSALKPTASSVRNLISIGVADMADHMRQQRAVGV